MKRERRSPPLALSIEALAADLSATPTPQPEPEARVHRMRTRSRVIPIEGRQITASEMAAMEQQPTPRASDAGREAPPAAAAAAAAPAPASAGVARIAAPGLPAAWAYGLGAFGALLWTGAFLAFVTGFGRLGPLDYGPFRDAIVAALAIFPALLIMLFVYALRQGTKLGADVRATRRLSDDLVGPLAVSAAQAGDLMIAMRSEIERASDAAADAEQRLMGLKDGISEESRRLTQAAQEAQAGARTLGEALGRERGELYTLTAALEARTLEVTEAVGRQSRLAADVSDLAQAQLSEAQAALAARAADLTAAASDVRDSAEAAAEVLAHHTESVGAAGDSLTIRLTRLSAELGGERDRLAALADGLKTDHEDLSARTESQHARLVEAAAQARADGEIVSAAAAEAGETLRNLIGETAEHLRGAAASTAALRAEAAADTERQVAALTQTAQHHRDLTAQQGRESIDALTGAADRAQAAASARLAELQEQAASLGATALQRIEQVNEAAFAAGQRADQAFDSRILVAKRAIDQSASAVEEAGQRAAQRIEAGLTAARAALSELDGLLTEVDGRFQSMPEEARQRAEAVRSVVERGVGDLTAAARRAAEETQAIDSAFQERVKRNYDTLSEAVRLMGRVAGAVDAAARAPAAAAAAAAATPAPVPPPKAVAPPAQIHALDLPPKAQEATAPIIAPVAAPLPMAVGDSHPRFAATPAPPEPGASLFLRTAEAAAGAPSDMGGVRNWADGGATDLFAPAAETVSPAQAAGLRPRLNLTSVSEPPPLAADGREPGAPPQGASDAWSWKELLSTLPEEPEAARAVDDETLADQLIGEIEALGLDAAALLPRSQVEDIAAALQRGSASAARESVRRLAPAAVRRLSRRVLTDTVLRRDAAEFVRRYAALVDDAARRDADGFLASALLGSDAGRAYLMLDAAVGDLPN